MINCFAGDSCIKNLVNNFTVVTFALIFGGGR